MIHGLKKLTVSAKEAESADLAAAKQKLDNTYSAFVQAIEEIDRSKKAWKSVASSGHSFSSGMLKMFSSNYDEQFRRRLRNTEEELENLCGQFKIYAELSQKDPVHEMERLLHEYMAEAQAIRKDFPKVHDAAKEYALYTEKTKKMASKADPKDEAYVRNLKKLEAAKDAYENEEASIQLRLDAFQDKGPTMWRYSYAVYWTTQQRLSAAIATHCTEPYVFASETVGEFRGNEQTSP